MSIKVMSWVWEHSQAQGIDRLVLLAIADSANDTGGQAWPSRLTLARKAGVDEKTVRRAVLRLVEMGELAVAERAGQGRANVYSVLMPTQGGQSAPGQNAPPAGAPRPRAGRPRGAESPNRGGTAPHNPSLNRPTGSLRDPGSAKSRDDVDRLCTHLADRIEANGSKRPDIGAKWRTAARLLLDRDGRTEQQIHNAIDWCQSDEFWRANVLSMPTLREKYDQLRLAAQRPKTVNGRSPTAPTPTPPPARDALADIDARVERERATERHRMAGVTEIGLGAMPA